MVKVGDNTVQQWSNMGKVAVRDHPEMSSSKIGLFQTYIYTTSSLPHHFENIHIYLNLISSFSDLDSIHTA